MLGIGESLVNIRERMNLIGGCWERGNLMGGCWVSIKGDWHEISEETREVNSLVPGRQRICLT